MAHAHVPKHNGILQDNGMSEAQSAEKRSSTVQAGRADDMLDILGYQAELVRSRSTFQVAFMSFVLASVPYGLATTLLYPIAGGGPVAVIWGWTLVCAIILCLAVSLGEITAVYPTAGGVYYQTFMLSPPRYQKITAWICGWSYALGNITITLSVNFGTTLFLVGCINIFQDSEGNGIFAPETYQYYLIFFAITLLCNAISALGNKYLPLLDVSFSGLIEGLRGTFSDLRTDLDHLLDVWRRVCNSHRCPCDRQEWPQQRQLRLYRIRGKHWMD
jgi:amino acid permease